MTDSKLSKQEQLKKRNPHYSKTLSNVTESESVSFKVKKTVNDSKKCAKLKKIQNDISDELVIHYSGWLGEINHVKINHNKQIKRQLRDNFLGDKKSYRINRRYRFNKLNDEQLELERQKHRDLWTANSTLDTKKCKRRINSAKKNGREYNKKKKLDYCNTTTEHNSKLMTKLSSNHDSKIENDSDKIYDIPKTTCFENEDKENPIIELIDRISRGCIDNDEDVTSETNKKLFERIFPMFKTFYIPLLPIQRVGFETCAIFLFKILKYKKIWNVYNVNGDLSKSQYNEIYCFLEENLIKCVSEFNEYCIFYVNNNNKDVENIINVTCSLKQLQRMFSLKHGDDPSSQLLNLSPCHMFYWPFISVALNFPDFSIIHENNNRDEFTLIDINNYKKQRYVSEDTFVYTKPSVGSNLFLSEFVIKFLNQLKTAIDIFSVSDVSSSEMAAELKIVITEFINDVNLCTHTIETNTCYYSNLSPYPYMRYLNHPYETKSENGENLIENIRLQQLSYPKISFSLDRFDVMYHEEDDDVVFRFDQRFFCNINNSITYRCILCDEDLGSQSSSQIIPDHYSKYHGFETDWNCVKCEKPFTTSLLTKIKWRHECLADLSP